ncbi:hypothetical protein BGZ76_010065 [Entomortierella beljakovae]|nr:hypothetical protein BGZ76_010065 [Entomortierella beljakovae]
METLPVETFQLICSYCSLHALSNLRLVSKPYRDRVDGSLTARRSHSTPKNTILPKGKHDRSACYVRVVLKRGSEPITVVFNNYSRQYNYLEFTQTSGPVKIDGRHDPNPTSPYSERTFGSLDLNIWEEQREESMRKAFTYPPPEPISTTRDLSSGLSSNFNTGITARRSSITQAAVIRGIEHQVGQELASNGPITPLSSTRPARNIMASAFGTSTSVNLTSNGPQSNATQEGSNYMTRFARMVLGSTGTGPQNSLTRTGMTAAELAQQAQQDFHTVEKEVLSSKKLYKFILTCGVHYIGDSDFVMRYTVSSGPKIQVDYIRASWKWVSSGVPVVLRSKISDSSEDTIDPLTVEDPFPHHRFGRIYAERYNRLLREIQQQEASHYVRGELALDGYDTSLLDRNFFSVNLYSEEVVTWITRLDSDKKKAKQEETSSSNAEIYEQDEFSESEWEDVTPKDEKKKEGSSPSKEELEDEESLKELVRNIKHNMGYLTTRNILEGMLVKVGFSRDLIWKYGLIKTQLTGPILPTDQAKLLVTKIIANENHNIFI